MDKQRIDAIRVELSIIADDIEYFIDENEIDENSTSEVDCKISKIEELRTSYRKLHNKLKIFLKQVKRSYVKETKRGSCH